MKVKINNFVRMKESIQFLITRDERIAQLEMVHQVNSHCHNEWKSTSKNCVKHQPDISMTIFASWRGTFFSAKSQEQIITHDRHPTKFGDAKVVEWVANNIASLLGNYYKSTFVVGNFIWWFYWHIIGNNLLEMDDNCFSKANLLLNFCASSNG